MSKPLCCDVFCGVGGWTEGFLAEGWDCVGFDIERHVYGAVQYPAQLVLQDAMTIHGKQFKDADCLVMSPPCQEYSYMAMPWQRGKQIARALRGDGDFPDGYTGSRTVAELTALFDACFRIQREAIEAAGHFIPLVVENVRGAIPWVGRSRWNFGSFHLWGDVPALMPRTERLPFKGGDRNIGRANGEHKWNTEFKNPGFRFDGSGKSFQTASVEGIKTTGHANIRDGYSHTRHLTNPEENGTKGVGIGSRSWHQGAGQRHPNDPRNTWSKSSARKAASAMIAKIPLTLARYIAQTYHP